MIAMYLVKLSLFFGAVGDPCTLPNLSKDRLFRIFPPWWEYMPGQYDSLNQCSPSLYGAQGQFQLDNIWLIGLAVVDILLRAAGLVAVISIMVAGAQSQFTSGNPEKAAAARKRLYNSLIGLGIVVVATAAVTFIGNQLAK